MEEWRDIEGYEGLYQISNMGNVRSLPTVNYPKTELRKLSLHNEGYVIVTLFKNNKKKTHRVHRLVAEAFIPNPDNKPYIDHIDTIKTNNIVDNLRWVTAKENSNNPSTKEHHRKAMNEMDRTNQKKASSENGKRAIKYAIDARPRKVLCITTNKVFDSIKNAEEYYGLGKASKISACCNGTRKSAGKLPDGTKLKWRYIDEQ